MAGKTIKGLTVEIGGDTTKLGKALQNIENQSRALSSELGEINRLLKVDPGNMDLLAQKQKVLADAVEATTQKLDTLKDAERQVQEQFERGEVSEEQLRALRREIIATEKKLQGYEKAAKETAEAAKKMGDGAEDAADELENTGDEAKKSAKKVDDFADSADEADKSSGELGETLADAAKTGLVAVGTAVGAVITGLIAAAESTREYRDEIGKLKSAFSAQNHSAETATQTYKELQGVIGETDQSVEAAQQISLLAQSEKDAAQWADLAAGVVGQFGDALQPETFYEAANETLKLNESTGAFTQMLEGCGLSVDEFNKGLAACTTEEEKQAYMLKVTEGALGAAGEKYKEVNAEVIRANEASEAWMVSMAEIGEVIDPIITDVKMLGSSLLSELVPGVQQIAEAFRGVLSGDAGTAESLGAAFSDIITQLLTEITDLAPTIMSAGISLIQSLLSGLISMAPTLATTAVQLIADVVVALLGMIPQLVTLGVELVLGLLNGLTDAIPQVVQALAAMIPQLVQTLVAGIPQLIQAGVDLLLALLQAIPQILPPLIAALPQIVMAVINGLLTAIPQLIDGALQFLLAIVDAIPLLVAQLVPAIPEIISTVILGLLDAVPQLLDAAVTLLLAIVEAIPLIVVELIKALPQIWETMKSYYSQLPGKLWAILTNLIQNFVRWGTESQIKVAEGALNILNAIVGTIKNLPGRIWTWLANAIAKVSEFGTNAVSKAKTAAKNILDAVVNGIKALPERVCTIGSNLVTGLWNGINNKFQWLIEKIQSFAASVLAKIKNFFGVHSPSTKTSWVGEMLDKGLAKGILDNISAPVNAIKALSREMLGETEGLNGLTLERNLTHSFVDNGAAMQQASMVGKLDQILDAIKAGQVLLLDGNALVGGTAKRMDSQLGMLRVLSARGAR